MSFSRLSRRQFIAYSATLPGLFAAPARAATTVPRFGPIGPVGPVGTPKAPPVTGKRWEITQASTYQNLLVDANFGEYDAVRIRANATALKNCEVRNGKRDGIEVYANDVLIENCRIHHFLAGTFVAHDDAHGITGRGDRLTVRNCEISYCSGDGWQMDPGRDPWSDVLIDHCKILTGPLTANAGAFLRGEQPGENGVDTKQSKLNARSKLIIRNSIFQGFAASGFISNPAALNVKENTEVLIENCVFYNNYISARLRGPGSNGGAYVTVRNCYFYDCAVAFRLEDKLQNLVIQNSRFGSGVQTRYRIVNGQPPGARIEGDQSAPPLATVLAMTDPVQ